MRRWPPRALDQPQRDHLPAAAHASRRRLPRAHLHAGPRAALRRPPDARQLPRLAGRRRRAARKASWCRSAASAWCACARRHAGSPSPRRRCAAAARSTLADAGADRALPEDPARAIRASNWVGNGPHWVAVMLGSREARCWRCSPTSPRWASWSSAWSRLGRAARPTSGARLRAHAACRRIR